MEITLGQCLLLHRIKKGLTHKELGSRVFPELNAPHQKIKKIESGVYQPKPDELKAIAKALNVSLSEIKSFSTTPIQDDRCYIDEKLFEFFPGLKGDVNIINQAAHMNREENALTIIEVVLKNCLTTLEQRLKELRNTNEKDIGKNHRAANA
jgi:transcriptional regulator with XRE-family HTH domain